MQTNAIGRKIIEDFSAIVPDELEAFESAVLALVDVEMNPNQFSTLVSIATDIGIRMLSKSLLLKHFNRGEWREGYCPLPAYRGFVRVSVYSIYSY